MVISLSVAVAASEIVPRKFDSGTVRPVLLKRDAYMGGLASSFLKRWSRKATENVGYLSEGSPERCGGHMNSWFEAYLT